MSLESGDDRRWSVWPLLLTLVASTVLFMLALGLAAFLMRDVQLVDAPLVRTDERVRVEDPGREPFAPLGDNELMSAVTAVEPILPACLEQARARDPSVPSRIVLRAELVSRDGTTGVVRSLRVTSGASPFLQHCLNQRGVGARFPVGQAGLSTVRWRASVEGGKAIIEPVAGD